jgi:hypothetical protein
VVLRTGPSAAHALYATLEIHIAISTLDDEGLVVRLRGLGTLNATPVDLPTNAWTQIYSGDASAPALRERLDDFAHLALDAAQNAGETAANVALDLPALA